MSAQDKILKNIDEKNWNSALWQLKNSIDSLEKLSEAVKLTDSEKEAVRKISQNNNAFPFKITPYYLSLINKVDPNCPLRRQVIPSKEEFKIEDDELVDPLAEERLEVVPGLVHRYQDRVLLILTDFCASYCRHCTRRRRVGRVKSRTKQEITDILSWLKNHKEVREVLISGGDPLLVPIKKLVEILALIKCIEHIRIIRIGTRVPVFLPQMITPGLAKKLSQFSPLYITTQFNHPDEITPESSKACRILVDAGIPVLNQTVLLRAINDCCYTIEKLCLKLIEIKVKPYYLMHGDMVSGTSHLRSSIKRGMEIIAAMRGRVSGIAIPTFIADIPGGKGKVPLYPQYLQWEDDKITAMYTYKGEKVPVMSGIESPSCDNCICKKSIK